MSVKTENKNVEKRAGNSPDAKVEFGLLDPRTLLVETNVRAEANLTPRFLKSIRDHGVLIAILVQRTEQGLRVRAGQRRTLAAIEVGVPVPAMIVQGDEDQVRRIAEQMVENDDRQALRHADRVAAFEQMSLLGVSAVDIANTTGHSTSDVKAALKVAKTKKAKAVQAKYDLTIDQAAVLAEFENDTEAVKTLTATAMKNPGQFEHEAQRQRDARKRAQDLQRARTALGEASVREIPNPGYDNKKITRLGDLADAQGNRLTEERHRTCPGHAAYLTAHHSGGYAPVYVCTDPRANKHAKQGGRVLGTPLSPQEKAERDAVRKYNPRWDSTVEVRRAWLAEFAKRSTAPKGAVEFNALSMLKDVDDLTSATGRALAAEWLGTKSKYSARDGIAEMIQNAAKSGKPGRVQQIALVMALAAIEARTDRKTWRGTNEARYFLALREFGYNLDEVEEIAAGLRTATQDDPSLQPAEANTAPQATPPVKAPTSTGDETKATGQTTRPAPGKPANGDTASDNADKAQPARNPRKVTTQVASTTTGAKPEPAKRQPVKPHAEKAARVPQPAKV